MMMTPLTTSPTVTLFIHVIGRPDTQIDIQSCGIYTVEVPVQTPDCMAAAAIDMVKQCVALSNPEAVSFRVFTLSNTELEPDMFQMYVNGRLGTLRKIS